MNDENTLIIILKSTHFIIPSNFNSLKDVRKDIYMQLIKKKQYKVKSQVSNETLQSFINNWVYKDVLQLTNDNIYEFDKLSQEFDRIKDIIELYMIRTMFYFKSITDNIKKLIKQINEKRIKLKTCNDQYQQIISMLFKNIRINQIKQNINLRKKIWSELLNNNDGNITESMFDDSIKSENGLLFTIDEKQKTAGVTGYKGKNENVLIPKSIMINSEEYIITKICNNSFKFSKVKSIQFPEDSEIKIIGKYAFSDSSLININIPTNVFLIDEYAFFHCCKLEKIEFSKNSKLESIEKEAFENCRTLKEIINFPSSIKFLKSYCFIGCWELTSFNIPGNSNLTSLGCFVITNCHVKNLTIPSSVQYIEKPFWDGLFYLENITIVKKDIENIIYYDNTFILGKSDPKSDIFDTILLARKNIQSVVIPSFITTIGHAAFFGCNILQSVQFENDSKLKILDKYAFYYCKSINEISLPKSVEKIRFRAFYSCENLKKINIPIDSELKSIGKEAFTYTLIEEFTILRNITVIKENAFACHKLKKVSFQKDSKLTLIQQWGFAFSSIEEIEIPKNVIQMDWMAFGIINLLKKVYFDPNSKLEIIGNEVFKETKITSISLPKNISKIKKDVFLKCKYLQIIEFQEISHLEYLDQTFFPNLSNVIVLSPKSLLEIIGKID